MAHVSETEKINIIGLHIAGMSNRDIAKNTRHSHKTVDKWVKAYEQGASIHEVPHVQPTRKVTRSIEKRIVNLASGKRRRSIRRVAQIMSTTPTAGQVVPISYETVRQVEHDSGLKPYKPIIKPGLNEEQKQKRVVFARSHMNVEWKQVVFIDEIKLTLFTGGRLGNEFVWAPNRSQVPILGRIKTGSSITLCAAVCYYGKTPLHFIYNNVDASTYTTILEQTIIPAANDIYQDQDWLLVQDSAPYHTASKVYQWLDNHAINYISKHSWPPNSPDLNIIENVWARICNQIATSKVRTLKGLKKIVSEVWENIDQSYIQSLVLSMHNRLTEVVNRHGGSTHY